MLCHAVSTLCLLVLALQLDIESLPTAIEPTGTQPYWDIMGYNGYNPSYFSGFTLQKSHENNLGFLTY